MKYVFFIFFALLGLYSCSSDKYESPIDAESRIVSLHSIPEYKLNGDTIDLEILGVVDVVSIDTFLFFRSLEDINSLRIYSSNSLKQLGQFYSKGNGPDELVNLSFTGDYHRSRDSLFVWVMDGGRMSFYETNLLRSLFENRLIQDKTVNCSKLYMTPIHSVDDGQFFVSSYTENIDYNLYNALEEKDTLLFKLFKEDVMPNDIYMTSLNSKISPDKQRVVIAMMHFNQIIYVNPFTGERFALSIDEPVSREYVGRKNSSERITYFSGIGVSDTRAWLLYEGISEEDLEKGQIPSQVLVTDWDGELKARLKLDQHLKCITIDTIYKKLYGITNDEQIVVYDISEWIV